LEPISKICVIDSHRRDVIRARIMQLFESTRERLLRGGHFGSVNVRFWPRVANH
jgi:hypothetical protein